MIKLTDTFYLDADDNCIMLVECKTGRRRYYSNLKDLFDGLLKHEMRIAVGESRTLEELSIKIGNIQDVISISCKPYSNTCCRGHSKRDTVVPPKKVKNYCSNEWVPPPSLPNRYRLYENEGHVVTS